MDKHWSDHLRDLCKDTHCPQYPFPYPECRDGWKDLLIGLIAAINKLGVPWSAGQIKEKFGTLRFYADISEPTESWLQEISKPDHKITKFDKVVLDYMHKTDAEKRELWEQFGILINDAEHASAKICEICSEPGQVRNMSWVQTLCEDCYRRER